MHHRIVVLLVDSDAEFGPLQHQDCSRLGENYLRIANYNIIAFRAPGATAIRVELTFPLE